MGLLLAASSCAQRSLVEVDVTGDSAFQAVTLRLIAGGTSKDFPSASFDTVTPFKAGLYLSDSVSGSVTVVANVLGGGGACIGAGQAAATGVASGAAVGPIALTVTHTSSCATTATGTGGASGGGTGGSSGGGTGGASGAGTGGASGGGTGGSSGGGTGGASGGGTGGSSGDGTGGASGGGTNLVTNGDFSNGTTGWGLPAMVGTVSALAVTNGALCVTLGSSSSATIGYPSGATPAFQINGGTSYTFSYQASSSGGATLEAKVGQTVPPYDATGSDWMNEAAGTSLQTFTHTFTRGATDGSMGVAFNVMGGPATVCIDNVSLTAN